jgi:hypothetical protein
MADSSVTVDQMLVRILMASRRRARFVRIRGEHDTGKTIIAQNQMPVAIEQRCQVKSTARQGGPETFHVKGLARVEEAAYASVTKCNVLRYSTAVSSISAP